jgi:type III secretion protein Q
MNEQTAWVGAQKSHRSAASNGYAEEGPRLVGSERVAGSLSGSPRLLAISELAAALAPLYGRGVVSRTIGGARWRFRWRCITGPMSGVEMRLRLGGIEVMLGIENLDPFGRAVDAGRPEVPAALRAAYLNGLGAPLWEELETLTQLALEVLEVGPGSNMTVSPECLGFELGRDLSGPATRGFLGFIDPDPERNAELLRALAEVSQREMRDSPPLPTHFRLQWAAVAGTTNLSAAEVRALEELDVVLVEDVARTPNSLECWLGVGPARRFAGRMSLRTGQLQLVHFGTGGTMNMTRTDTDAGPLEEAGFGEIPVSLRFELAQWNASLAQMASLAPGAVIDLGQRVDEHAVSVWVEQRCVGKGQLVAIGERLGVRLLSIFAGQSPEDPQRSGAESTDQKGM